MKLRVHSIFTKIVVWAVTTVLISLIGFVVTSALVSARIFGRNASPPRLNAMFLDDARRAFQEGGPRRLEAFLKKLNAYTDSEYFLTDGRGIDLLSGEDRSSLRGSIPSAYRFALSRFLPRTETIVRVRRSRDGRFRLISVMPPPAHFDPWESLSHFLWLPVLIAVLCYLLAVHLASEPTGSDPGGRHPPDLAPRQRR